MKWAREKVMGREKCPSQVSNSGHSAQLCCLHAGADYLPAICIRLKRTNIFVITMFFVMRDALKRQLACNLFKKSLGLAVSLRLRCSVYSQARSHYWSTRGLWPAPSPTWAGSPLLRRPGDPELPQVQRRTKMKWGPQAKLIDEALLKYYFVNISLLPRYIFIRHTKSSQNT